jgi:peroxiredoxin
VTGVWLISYFALWLLLVVLAVLVIGILRQIGVLHAEVRRFRRPPVTTLQAGQTAPDVVLSTLDGQPVRVSDFAGRAADFVVISPQCSGCETLLKQLAETDVTDAAGAAGRVIVSIGDKDTTATMVGKAGLIAPMVLVDPEGRLREQWGVQATPITVQVDEHLRVLRQMLGGGEQLHPAPLVPA